MTPKKVKKIKEKIRKFKLRFKKKNATYELKERPKRDLAVSVFTPHWRRDFCSLHAQKSVRYGGPLHIRASHKPLYTSVQYITELALKPFLADTLLVLHTLGLKLVDSLFFMGLWLSFCDDHTKVPAHTDMCLLHVHFCVPLNQWDSEILRPHLFSSPCLCRPILPFLPISP